jgi:hypothetical protein
MSAVKKQIHIAPPGESKMEQETKRFNKRALIGSVVIHLFFFLLKLPHLELTHKLHDDPKLIPIKMTMVTPPSKSTLIKNKVEAPADQVVKTPPKVEDKKIENGTDRAIKNADKIGDKLSHNTDPVQKGDPKSKKKEKYKPGTDVRKTARTQVGSGSAPSKVRAENDNTGGSGDTYKGEDFTNVTDSIIKKGQGIKRNAGKNAIDDGGAGKGKGGGIGDGVGGGNGDGFITGSPNGTADIKKIATNVGSLTGSAKGRIDSQKGFDGLASKGTIVVAGVPTEKIAVSTIDPDAIRRLLRDHIPQFRSCYQRELDHAKDAEGLQGVVNFRFVIGTAGRVTKSAVTSDEIRSDKVRDCMTNVLEGIQFPAPKGGRTVEVNQPMNLLPKRI